MPHRPYRVALNGYGRVGRCVLRALYERGSAFATAAVTLDSARAAPATDVGLRPADTAPVINGTGLKIVAINDLADTFSLEYLTRFDSTHGRFPGSVQVAGDGLQVNGDRIQVLRSATPEAIDWAALGIDLVLECSGAYNSRADGQRFLAAGAPRVLFSQPMASAAAVDATIVYGVNQASLNGTERLVSNASCTTNCGVPLLKVLNQAIGLEYVSITTIHSAMNDQPVIDAYHHEDLRRTRSAFQSVVPVSTGLARGIERLLPELTGRIQAKAVRVPTLNVSCLDITLLMARDTDAAEINRLLRQAAQSGPLKGLLAYTELPHASCDFNHDAHSAIVDGSQTRVSGPRLVNLLAWFDNEWGFANRMLDVAEYYLRVAAPETAARHSSAPLKDCL